MRWLYVLLTADEEGEDMRRSDREITDRNEMIEVMRRCDVCRLALNDEGYPYILPLNFGMEVTEEKIVLYFHGAMEGRKYGLIERDNRASFEMDCAHRLVMDEERGHCTMEYESVIGQGKLTIVSEEEKEAALERLMRQYRPENAGFNKAAIPRTTVLKLTVEAMTGKKRKKG